MRIKSEPEILNCIFINYIAEFSTSEEYVMGWL
jgi:hypothetical protein